MSNEIYKLMIKDGSQAFLHVQAIKNENGEYEAYHIKDINKSFELLFNTNKEEVIDSYFLFPENRKEEFARVIKRTKENKKCTVKKYLIDENLNVNIEMYFVANEEIFLRFTKLSAQNIKLSSVLKKSPFSAWSKDINGVYIDVNDAFLKFHNKTYDEVVGKTDFDIWDEERAKEYVDTDKKVISENRLITFEEAKYVENGKNIYVEISKWPYTDIDNETILGVIGIGLEVTDKVKLRKNIEKNEQNFLEIANNLEEVLIIRDIEKATYISPSFKKLFNCWPDKMFENFDSWVDYFEEIEIIDEKNYNNFEKPYISNVKLKRKNEETKWIYSKFVPIIDEDGKVRRKIGILSDITMKKQLDLELEKLRMEFFSNLSHELRTPINLIFSALQLVDLKLSKNGENYKDGIYKYIEIINQNGLRLLKLVNNLIDMTKIDSGYYNYNPKNYNIVSCVENICMSVVPHVEYHNMNITFDTDVEEKVISFDLDHIERIMLNLISNAVKFNKPNGDIKVEISTKDKIQIKVKDNGIGIPEDKIEKIFGRFEQVNKNSKREREGSGIGLSLVKSLVEIHKGQVSVNSKLGEGSEFIITLPDRLIIEEEEKIVQYDPTYIQRMQVEFSDIYK